jgi:hypothetical protein
MADPVVREIEAPLMDASAPRPAITATDDALSLAYSGPGEEHFRVAFTGALVHYFGPPNDKTLRAHPMAAFGLSHLGAFEVQHSRWIEELRTMDRADRRHDDARFDRLRHFIWAFRDSTFECLAEGFAIA